MFGILIIGFLLWIKEERFEIGMFVFIGVLEEVLNIKIIFVKENLYYDMYLY